MARTARGEAAGRKRCRWVVVERRWVKIERGVGRVEGERMVVAPGGE